MNLFKSFQSEIFAVVEGLVAEYVLPSGLDTGRITAEPPRDPGHGDISTNAALVLAKGAKMKPRELAEKLAERLGDHAGVISAEVAGAGFINLRLDDGFWRDRLIDVLKSGTAYGDSDIGKEKGRVNVEFVSVNPTGPLHIGHGRGAVFGDVLASLLEKAGFDVSREYYINDTGGQIEALARSVYHRYREALGEDPGEMAEGLYPGDYLIPVGQALAETDGKKWLSEPEAKWMEHCANVGSEAMMALIREDLEALSIHFAEEEFRSERELHRQGKVGDALDWLEEKGLIYTGVLEPP